MLVLSVVRFGLGKGLTSGTAFEDAPGSTNAVAPDSWVMVFSLTLPPSRFAGGLIHTALGTAFGSGSPLGNRSGLRANASASTRARCSRLVAARPWWTSCGVNNPSPTWWCSVLYQGKKSPQKLRPCSSEPKRSGKSGRYFSVLNCDSENGLSFETCGRE